METSKIVRTSVLALILCGSTYVVPTHAGGGDPVAGVASFNLTPEQQRQLTQSANEGDNEAAIRLANFYDFVRLDPDEATDWFRRAAKNGHAEAQYASVEF